MKPNLLLSLFGVAVTLALAGCSGKSSCASACEHLASCSPGAACPLSAVCTAKEQCRGLCLQQASCEALRGDDPEAAATLTACESDCDVSHSLDRGPGGDGVRTDARRPVDRGPGLDGSSPCALPLTRCGAACVDTRTSPDHCGQCFKPCVGGVCSSGACQPQPDDCRKAATCPPAYYCDLNDGSCRPGCADNTQCPQPGSCELSTHSCVCDSGHHLCQAQCVIEGPSSCGAACTNCPVPPFAQATCVNHVCGFECKGGHHQCAGQCVVESAESCGASCKACPVPPTNGKATCAAGVCGFSCELGFLRCGSACCTATDVQAGHYHTCALTSAGGVKCWGKNDVGAVGDGGSVDRPDPTDVVGLSSGVAAIAVGGYHTCARAGGAVKCWGANYQGQVGDGTSYDRSKPVTVIASGAVEIVASVAESCARLSSGAVQCWGYGFDKTPKATGHSSLAAVGLGLYACWLTAAGAVECPGWSAYDGSIKSGATWLSSPWSHACAVVSGGVKCWGENFNSQLGNGTNTAVKGVVNVVGLASGATVVMAGSGDHPHTCALTTGGAARCWGNNYFGELGDGTKTERGTPITVNGFGAGVVAITVGGSHTCARLQAGTLHCWGRNSSGQLGDGTTTLRPSPAAVSGQ